MNDFTSIYFKIPEIIRFTVFTIINSLIAYLFYIALFIGMMFKEHFYLATILNFIVPVSLSFCTMKLFVFKTRGDLLIEYIKTVIVFIGALLLNILVMLFLFRFLGIEIKAVIIINMIIALLYSYILLKKYAFNSNVDFLGRQ